MLRRKKVLILLITGLGFLSYWYLPSGLITSKEASWQEINLMLDKNRDEYLKKSIMGVYLQGMADFQNNYTAQVAVLSRFDPKTGTFFLADGGQFVLQGLEFDSRFASATASCMSSWIGQEVLLRRFKTQNQGLVSRGDRSMAEDLLEAGLVTYQKEGLPEGLYQAYKIRQDWAMSQGHGRWKRW